MKFGKLSLVKVWLTLDTGELKDRLNFKWHRGIQNSWDFSYAKKIVPNAYMIAQAQLS